MNNLKKTSFYFIAINIMAYSIMIYCVYAIILHLCSTRTTYQKQQAVIAKREMMNTELKKIISSQESVINTQNELLTKIKKQDLKK